MMTLKEYCNFLRNLNGEPLRSGNFFEVEIDEIGNIETKSFCALGALDPGLPEEWWSHNNKYYDCTNLDLDTIHDLINVNFIPKNYLELPYPISFIPWIIDKNDKSLLSFKELADEIEKEWLSDEKNI